MRENCGSVHNRIRTKNWHVTLLSWSLSSCISESCVAEMVDSLYWASNSSDFTVDNSSSNLATSAFCKYQYNFFMQMFGIFQVTKSCQLNFPNFFFYYIQINKWFNFSPLKHICISQNSNRPIMRKISTYLFSVSVKRLLEVYCISYFRVFLSFKTYSWLSNTN